MTEVNSETRFLHAIEMGLGAWQWGDRLVWQFGQGYDDQAVREAFKLAVEEGVRFIDTAEVYGNGLSEHLLGRFLKETEQPVLIATKYFPFPWRLSRSSVPRALKNSLERIGVESVDLYQIHWPTPLMSVDRMMDGMAECVKSGMTRTVGVSNFNQTQMLAAYSALARQNIPLASNQVPYSLLNRKVEKNGLLARCRELGIRLIAYSPLEKGLLSGKYNAQNRPPGIRARTYASLLPKIEPLLKLMTTIGQDHGGKTNAQVALNWLICKGALPIPGAKNVRQAQENIGALGWRLTEEEIAKLDEMSDKIFE
ncbi:MAG: aldo/keto reductase [Chloroflexota bacterium]|nr:aldo/keto reductase [Chloroflexota bacterium]MBI5705276.1 aldo/keto reductase [Chloroflexota bacterium]